MKKALTIILIIITLFSLNSCFLFKPVQKTCPAYSLNELQCKTNGFVYAKHNPILKEKSFK